MEEIERETGMTRREQDTARKVLRSKGFVFENYERLTHKMWFQLNVPEIEKALIALRTSSNDVPVHSPMHESAIGECTNAPVPNGVSSQSSTEITSETTSETTLQAAVPQSPSAPVASENSNTSAQGSLSTPTSLKRFQSAEGAMPPEEILPAPPRRSTDLPGADVGRARNRVKGPSDPRHQVVIRLYSEAFHARFGWKYPVAGAADGAAVARILRAAPDLNAVEIVGILQAAWLSRKDFHQSMAQKLTTASSAWNQLRIAYGRTVTTPDLQDPNAF